MEILCFCGLIASSEISIRAQEIEAPEPQVKAAFVYNLAKLVEWPTNTFPSPTAPLRIGVVGRDPVFRPLETTLRGKTIDGHPVQLVRASANNLANATNCHILFFGESERRTLSQVLAQIDSLPILTVSDMKGFRSVGMIELVKTNEHINLGINPVAAERAGLKLSSRLLRLDRSLHPPEEATPDFPKPPEQ